LSASVVDYARSAFDLIGDFERLSTPSAVINRLATALHSYGYSAFLVTGVPEPPDRVEPYILANGWPAEFAEQYSRANYYLDDPIAAWCRRTVDPYEWAEAQYDFTRQPRAAEVMLLAADHGMKRGFCVPIVRGSGAHACVTMAGERPDFHPRAKRAIHIISLFAHASVVRTLRGEQERTTNEQKRLTKREREALQWAAVGKSAWETSVIMNISERTVIGFLANAQRKLNASNRTHAVVAAIRAREITL
jgi:LuxR family quorum sensing-dependent transcriptional regulator